MSRRKKGRRDYKKKRPQDFKSDKQDRHQRITIPSFQSLNALLKPIDAFATEQDRVFDEMEWEEQEEVLEEFLHIRGVIGLPLMSIRSTMILFYYDRMKQTVQQSEELFEVKEYLYALLHVLDLKGQLHYINIVVKSNDKPSWLRSYNSFARKMLQVPKTRMKQQFVKIRPKIKQLLTETVDFLHTPLSEMEEKFQISTPQQIAWYSSLIDCFAVKLSNIPLETYHQKLDYLLDKAIRLKKDDLEYFIDAIKEDNEVFGTEIEIEP
ncbi:MAG: hypothetical protein ACFFCQ_17195 [Promethearchaeota archaeon]